MQKSFFFFPSLNPLTFEGSSLHRKIAKFPRTPLWQEFDHRLETISFNLRIYILVEEWLVQTTQEICFPLVTKNLLGCAVTSRIQFQNEKFHSLTLLWRANQRPKRIILLLPTSFSRPGSAKISENPQKSSDLPHHGLQPERDRGYKEPRTRTQRPRTGHKIIAAVESPQLMGWECHSQHTFDASARSLCSIAEQTSSYVFTHLTGRFTTLTDSSIRQLHKKCNSKPSWRLTNRKV